MATLFVLFEFLSPSFFLLLFWFSTFSLWSYLMTVIRPNKFGICKMAVQWYARISYFTFIVPPIPCISTSICFSSPPIFYTFLLCFCLLRSFCQRQTTYLLLGFSILIILYIHSFSHLHNVHSFAHLYIEPSRSRLYGS